MMLFKSTWIYLGKASTEQNIHIHKANTNNFKCTLGSLKFKVKVKQSQHHYMQVFPTTQTPGNREC